MQIRFSIAEEINHLPQRMNAGIGSPGTGHTSRRAEKRRYRLFQNRLNRRPVRLHLPAKVIRAVILNSEFDVHEKTRFKCGVFFSLEQATENQRSPFDMLRARPEFTEGANGGSDEIISGFPFMLQHSCAYDSLHVQAG
jgi:hypothetical protein